MHVHIQEDLKPDKDEAIANHNIYCGCSLQEDTVCHIIQQRVISNRSNNSGANPAYTLRFVKALQYHISLYKSCSPLHKVITKAIEDQNVLQRPSVF